MGRSTTTVFVLALVMGTLAFIATLMLAPMPEEPRPTATPMTPEQIEAQAESRRAQRAYNNNRRDLLIRQDWTGLGETAGAVVEHVPLHLWAHLDALHAIANGAGSDADMRAGLDALAEALRTLPPGAMPGWQVDAARGWLAWFEGDESAARAAWLDAADGVLRSQQGDSGLYNRASYLSLAGEADEALATFERALAVGWGSSGSGFDSLDYAMADYDNRDLIADPRFTELMHAWEAGRAVEAEEQARAAYEALDAAHAEAHPPLPASGGDDAPASP